ncbi:methyl-galactoside transport system substrate-binding protein [Hydrogenoanaerobacterium saccharovorans]|uniref:D-galactose/methyl-galactoside binding periplasmic protein MglB n=1 Tax=Hydrogenoanaerobacterium saccharovorans TaxID=474960 RepID=A0A1H8ALL6_9FIRM|nr:galactose ABC transporter substrate-binding protein [Hydrogenoanaerobacterium saccharovorans]RPF47880.1 methyl-galactoside transport system substrate-binding protein [Hydrogenoanaerobacterium saccharovorans]SEM71396.1 methyl-galactoside transport system substrate-binding protein [Hydrogenoanaerobacterium saccharovorans]
MKKLTKVLAMILALTMMLSLAACGGGASTPAAPAETSSDAPADNASEAAPAAKEVNVGVAIYKFDDNFMTLYRTELERYFKEDLSKDGVKYNVTIVDGKGDQAEQTNQIDTFIANKVDVIICNLVQSSSASTVVEKAKTADIPVVFINREPTAEDLGAWDKVAYVGADARQSGTFQGEIIAETPNKGDMNGDGVVSYVMIMGDPENVDAQYRTEFSVKALKDAGIKTEELFKQRGDWDQAKGQELANTALTQFGNKVDVIFCNNDAMALGAVQAIAANGRTVGKDIYLVGVDALEEAQNLVKEGGMTGTVLNDHIGQSHTAADVAVKAIAGEKLEKNYTVDYVKVTK